MSSATRRIRRAPWNIGEKYWPLRVRFDPNFGSLEGLEWLLGNPEDVVVCGLMVREFGSRVDEQIYGESARKVRNSGRGPEFLGQI